MKLKMVLRKFNYLEGLALSKALGDSRIFQSEDHDWYLCAGTAFQILLGEDQIVFHGHALAQI